MKTIKLDKKFAVLISALILVSAVLGSTLTQMYFPQLGKIAGRLEDPLEAWSEASYVTWQYNSTYYACRNMSTNIVDYFGASDDAAIQWGIDRCTSHGGSVYVKAPTYTGTYSASVTLKDNVTLILDKGARGITVSIDSGADGTLVDYENGYRKEWVAGVLYTFMDLRTGKLWWQGENRTDTLAFPEQTASYIVFQDGSLTKMKNGTSGQIDAYSTNASRIINWACGNLTSGGVIFLKDLGYVDGQVIIDQSDITLMTDKVAGSTISEGTWITQVKIDSTSENVDNIRIQGLSMRELFIYANVHWIQNIKVIDCAVFPNATYHGIIFGSNGPNTVWQFTNFIHFERCWFYCYGGATTWGLTTFINITLSTDFYYDSCVWQMFSGTEFILFKINDGALVVGLHIIAPRIYQGSVPFTAIWVNHQTTAYKGLLGCDWIGGRIEANTNYTVLYYNASTVGCLLDMSCIGVKFQGKVQVFNVQNYYWYPTSSTAGKQRVDFSHNCFRDNATLGYPPWSNHVDFIFKDNEGLNPIGYVATPFKIVGSTCIIIHPHVYGASATPTANTNYEVQGTDIILTSTGGTGVNITVTDLNGNALFMDAATLTLQYIPRGYFVNFGAFSVAPTVTVYFE